MHHPTDRIIHTTAFGTPVVEHWLGREIAQWVHPMKDRSDLTEFRVAFNGNRGSVTLIYGDKRKTPCALGAVMGGGTKIDNSTAGGGPVFPAAPNSARSGAGVGVGKNQNRWLNCRWRSRLRSGP